MSIRMVTYVQSLLRSVVASRIETVSQICASILGDDWSPTLSVMAICITIQSMLASCKVRLWYQKALSLSDGHFYLSPEERIVSSRLPSCLDNSC